MQHRLLFYFFTLWCSTFFCCGNNVAQDLREKATAKHNEAVKVYMEAKLKNFSADSIQLAMDLINESVVIDSTYVWAYQTKIQFLTNNNQYEDALDVINSAFNCGLEKDNPILFCKRGILYEKLNQPNHAKTDFFQAIPLYNKWIERYPDDYNALSIRAIMIYLADGKEAGIQAYNELLNKPLKDIQRKDVEMILSMITTGNRNKIIESINP